MRHRLPPDEPSSQVDLALLDADFAAAIPPPSQSPVPDGRYHVQVEHVHIATARTSGRPVLIWRLRILGPASHGRLLWKNSVLATPDSLRWLKHDLCLCGLDLRRLSDLAAHLVSLVDVELDVTKRTSGEHENVYFNRRLEPAPPDDDVPF